MKRWIVFLYGIFSYLMFLGVFLYAVGFIGNLWISNSLDSEPSIGFWAALGIDVGLLLLFAVQHSVMARPVFKKWLTRYIPESAERSTYILLSNVAMILIFAFWQPLGGTIWSIENQLVSNFVYGIYFFGWLFLLVSTFGICHFDLFGLRQIWLFLNNKPYTYHEFNVSVLYSMVRHPIYLAWSIIIWATPTMTMSHLVFAAGYTLYILVAIRFEERDLVGAFGQQYRDYRKQVPMMVPGPKSFGKNTNNLTSPPSVFDERFEKRA